MTKPIRAASLPAQAGATSYPAPFDAAVVGREKRKLGDLFGLTTFGLNPNHLQ